MYVCICNAVTDKDVKKAVDDGANSMSHLQERLNIGRCCGACSETACKVLDKHLSRQLDQVDLLSF
jgi:bacterioferritin-associated ferredoxin